MDSSTTAKKYRHYNAGHVWGRVSGIREEVSEGKNYPYLSIQVECPNELYGNVKTYGRLCGEHKINAFLDYHKQHPGSAYRFFGMFSQYDKTDDMRLSNYTFHNWLPINGLEFRATFVLVGEVRATRILEDCGWLHLHIHLEGKKGYSDKEADFEIYAVDSQMVSVLKAGQTVYVKGMMKSKDKEGYFGETTGLIRPYAEDIDVRGEPF